MTTPRTSSSAARRAMTLLQAMDDANLFAPWFRDASTWTAWRSFLAALFALPMSDEQLAVYRACTKRGAAPARPAREAWLVIGRRGGKSFVLALVAVFLAAFHEYRQYLAPGERGTVLVIATDRKQARVILRYVRGMLTKVPMLKRMVERETASGFDLSNSTTIEIHSASHRSTRGYTIIAALCDELAFWPTEDSAEPDYEVIRALRPGMATIPGAMLLCGSSPYARRGALWDSYRRHFGRDDDPVLVWQAATRTMNPSVPQSLIDEETERDPASAAAEYGAQFRVDVESFVAREVVDAAVAQGRRELPPVQGVGYRAFVDPSGGSADSMTLAVAHRDRTSGNVVLDAVRERKPPFSPEAVVDEFCALLLQYGLRTVTGDRYAGEWPRERFRVHGVTYEPSEPPKSDIYRDVLPLLNAGRVELLDLPRLASQLCGLERRTARGGRDSIDHAPGAHDDLANAACGALRLCAGVTGAEQWAAFGRSHSNFGFSHRHAITMSSN